MFMSRADDPLRWAQTKIELGKALILICEQKFDQSSLQDGVNHIREGVEAARPEARNRLTETANAAIQRSEAMLANRRRFSIRWNV